MLIAIRFSDSILHADRFHGLTFSNMRAFMEGLQRNEISVGRQEFPNRSVLSLLNK